MKLNQNILPTISGAVDLNVTSSWISSFNLSKHPGERGYMAWIDWQSSITRAYQTPVCNYEGSVWQQDLICAGIRVAEICAERSSAPYCDPSLTLICVSHLPTPRHQTLPAQCFLRLMVVREVRVFFRQGGFDSLYLFPFNSFLFHS